jgi:hypothetical protein
MTRVRRAVTVTCLGILALGSVAAAQAADPIVGTWYRAQTCEEMVAAFDAEGLLETHLAWAQADFWRDGGAPGLEDPCAGAPGPVGHYHAFSAEGRFESTGEFGAVLDGGDYVVLSEGVLDFPSHASEFGYAGEVAVAYAIDDAGVATFDVLVPEGCVDACADAHAWAISAFGSGPWQQPAEAKASPAPSDGPT